MTVQTHQTYPQNLTIEELANPYLVIEDFYSSYNLPNAKKNIDSWLDSSYRTESWNRQSPCDLLHFYQQVIRLIEAGWLMQQMDNSERISDLSENALGGMQLMNADLYCSPIYKEYSWDYFPRSLKKKEYINPYKVLPKIFRFHTLAEWKSDLDIVLHFSLSTNYIEQLGERINVLGIKKYLDKLVDACHLISIREFEHPKTEDTAKEKTPHRNVMYRGKNIAEG